MATISSINRDSAANTSADSLVYVVTFSAAVTGVDVTDFVLNRGGSTNGTISSVSGSGTTWYVTVTGVTGDGALRLDSVSNPDIRDAGNVLITGTPYTGGQAYTLDNTGPVVTTVVEPTAATYHTGQVLQFTVNLDDAAVVTGTPRIALTVGSATVYATYDAAASTSTALVFRYTVKSGDVDSNGISVGALELNGGAIKDALGNNANLTLNGLDPTTGVIVDATDPTIVSVTGPTAKTYLATQDLVFTVKYNENVFVDETGGTPYIAVTVGDNVRLAEYDSGSASDTLTFIYKVQVGDSDADGVAIANAIILNGGTIRDAQLNNAVITGVNVSGLSGVRVDAVAPTATEITRVGDRITKGGTVQFTVKFSESVSNVDASDFTLVSTAGGTISSVTGSGATYTVTVTGVSGDGAVDLTLKSSGTGIVDAANIGIVGGLVGSDGFAVDNTPPPAPTIALVAGNDVISAGETSGLKITGTAEGGSTVRLVIGGVTKTATLVGSNWSYDVTDDDLRAMGSGSETLSVTATDPAGNVSTATTRDISIDIGVVPGGGTGGGGTGGGGTGGGGTKPTTVDQVVKLPAAEATKAVLETANIIPDSAKVSAGSGTAATVYKNISDAITEYQAGSISLAQLETRLVDATLPTTGVAHDVYKFFTGSAPTATGMAYLIDSTANTTDLTDPYYGIFTLENRYINFSVNLGKLGEGRATFEAKYGAMTFAQAVEKAYGDIIGFANAVQAGVDFSAALAYIESKRSYFEALGGDALGAKAAMVGYVISVGSTFHLGNYYEELKDYVLDGVVANAASSPAADWDLI